MYIILCASVPGFSTFFVLYLYYLYGYMSCCIYVNIVNIRYVPTLYLYYLYVYMYIYVDIVNIRDVPSVMFNQLVRLWFCIRLYPQTSIHINLKKVLLQNASRGVGKVCQKQIDHITSDAKAIRN